MKVLAATAAALLAAAYVWGSVDGLPYWTSPLILVPPILVARALR